MKTDKRLSRPSFSKTFAENVETALLILSVAPEIGLFSALSAVFGEADYDYDSETCRVFGFNEQITFENL